METAVITGGEIKNWVCLLSQLEVGDILVIDQRELIVKKKDSKYLTLYDENTYEWAVVPINWRAYKREDFYFVLIH